MVLCLCQILVQALRGNAPMFGTDPSTGMPGGVPDQAHRSDANRNIIPEVSIAHKINDNWYIGAGMFGTAGMGTDYRNATPDMPAT